MKETIQTSANYLADLCLENSDKYSNYTDEDLVNATLIFNHIFVDIIFSTNKQKLNEKGLCDLAETSGKALRELILASTGKDMHQLVKNLNEK